MKTFRISYKVHIFIILIGTGGESEGMKHLELEASKLDFLGGPVQNSSLPMQRHRV